MTLVGGRHSLGGSLGSGGTGRVYLARDGLLGREVALTVLHERHAGDPESARRLEGEAKHAASLYHPNVAAVYDFRRAEGGAAYVAMEYVPSGTLRAEIDRRGVLPPQAAAGGGRR